MKHITVTLGADALVHAVNNRAGEGHTGTLLSQLFGKSDILT